MPSGRVNGDRLGEYLAATYEILAFFSLCSSYQCDEFTGLLRLAAGADRQGVPPIAEQASPDH